MKAIVACSPSGASCLDCDEANCTSSDTPVDGAGGEVVEGLVERWWREWWCGEDDGEGGREWWGVLGVLARRVPEDDITHRLWES